MLVCHCNISIGKYSVGWNGKTTGWMGAGCGIWKVGAIREVPVSEKERQTRDGFCQRIRLLYCMRARHLIS